MVAMMQHQQIEKNTTAYEMDDMLKRSKPTNN
jgi:hypothetical protein